MDPSHRAQHRAQTESSFFDEFAFASHNRASGAPLTCMYSPLSYLSLSSH